ncbi:MAG TPA: hypothetical protein VH255_04815 [Verrucomicrobiae bacterium]|nr:hypothetical protein [Verrucomicrobiae bacterium]
MADTIFAGSGLAEIAAQNAMDADFVILSSSSGSAISPELEAWFESWIDRREVADGALVNLVTPATTVADVAARNGFLQEISRRAKLDLLSVPTPNGKSSAEVLIDLRDSFSQRPMHSDYGLNE